MLKTNFELDILLQIEHISLWSIQIINLMVTIEWDKGKSFLSWLVDLTLNRQIKIQAAKCYHMKDHQ